MKKILLILLLLPSLDTFSQEKDFQGFILYKYEFIDSSGNDITDQLKEKFGLEQHYYINFTNYKSYNEKGEITQLYNSKSNKYFFRSGNQIRSVDASLEFPKLFEVENLKETEAILGYECKSLKVKSENGETIYFFNSAIKVNPDTFKRHRFGSWSNYLRASNGALPLKFEVIKEGYTWKATAILIEEKKLKDDDFEIEKILKSKK